MGLSVKEIYEDFERLQALCNDYKFPANLAFRLKILHDKLLVVVQTVLTIRKQIVEDCGVKQEDGKYKITDQVTADTRWNAVLAEKSEHTFQKIKIAELGKIEIKPADLVPWIFEE